MRNFMGLSLVFCLGLCLTSASVRDQADADKGIKELQGKWRAVEMQTAGISTPKEVLDKARLEFKADEWIWHSGGPVDVKSRIRLDPVADLLFAHHGPPERFQDKARRVAGIARLGTRQAEMTPRETIRCRHVFWPRHNKRVEGVEGRFPANLVSTEENRSCVSLWFGLSCSV